MNYPSITLIITTTMTSFVGFILSQTVALSQEAELLECIKQYTNLGISPDAALTQCQQTNLADCIKRLIGKRYIAQAVKEANGRYLIDLGDNETRWLEGGAWKDKLCSVNRDGPFRRVANRNVWTPETNSDWFRQGWCKEPQIELDQNYSVDEAEKLCKLGLQPKMYQHNPHSK